MDIFSAINRFLYDLVKWWLIPPRSTVFVFLLAFLINLVSTAFIRLMIDVDRLREKMREVKKFNELKKKAQETGDKKLLIRVKKEEAKVLRTQLEISRMQMTPSLILLPLILVFWWLLLPFFGSMPVVKLPFSIPFLDLLHGGTDLTNDALGFLGWYMLVSFVLNPLIQRLFRIPRM